MKTEDENALVFAVLGWLLVSASGGSGVIIPWGDGWVWPVTDIVMRDGTRYHPSISQEHKLGHYGVDIMFRRRTHDDRAAEFASGSVNGSPWHFAPPGTPIVAARDGRVWSAGNSPRGKSVVIDHGKPFATYYQHLQTLSVATGALVKAGQVIGTMGFDPLDSARLRHLHFSVWYKGAGDNASVDPAQSMPTWARPSTVYQVA